ncbi:MAG TPA: type VI secretion system ATPase TssH [Victivallales bacterium]|nr:type VI secretion system ATPase TssH [Victivallales bacterium]
MAEISRKDLFKKLNDFSYKSLDKATVFCKLRGNPNVEFVHWLHQVISQQNSDIHEIIKHFNIDLSAVSDDIVSNLEKLPSGATGISGISPYFDSVIEQAWLLATLKFNDYAIRTGHILYAILVTRHLSTGLTGISRQFLKINTEKFAEDFFTILKESQESRIDDSKEIEARNEDQDDLNRRQKSLELYSIDLTDRAKKGELDPITGRDDEIRQIIDILMRRRQNNPILTGEAGVGKTAVVEGFAQKIADGNVPKPLGGVTLRVLDIGLLQAGASVKGEFENRLKNVIEEVQASLTPIILFIDEAHTLIGAGGSAGTGDAANLLKPALARGTLRTIAATTWSEYKKYIEKDPALTRRFQVVKVDEPNEDRALLMLRGVASMMEEHHRVLILDEALEAAVKLSHRYIPDRQLPDKAVSLLDTTCARIAVNLDSVPAYIDSLKSEIFNLEKELATLTKEEIIGFDHSERINLINENLSDKKKDLDIQQKRWDEESELVTQILNTRDRLRNFGISVDDEGQEISELDLDLDDADSAKNCEDAEDIDINDLKNELISYQEKLKLLQGENPLILPNVDSESVGSVVAEWTGIPVGKMVKNEIKSVLNLSDTLKKRIIGQNHALDAISKRIRTSRAGVDNPNRPVGVFMLSGPSGVGKTETALALSEALYGSEDNLITINMSEFQEAHTVSTLKGAPPGYVGYGEGGVLTEAVRRRPYSIVLLDEMEKAHPDVHEIFYQVFDKGVMEDGEGRKIDFKNTIILLTSNVGSDIIHDLCEQSEDTPDPAVLEEAIRASLLKAFPAALLGRLTVVPYYPADYDMLNQIIELQMNRVQKRLSDSKNINFEYSDSVKEVILDRCRNGETGARMVDAVITQNLLPDISTVCLNALVDGKNLNKIAVDTKDSEFIFEAV